MVPPATALLFPSLFTVRVRISEPSEISEPELSTISCRSGATAGRLNCAEATKRSVPVRTRELSLLPPSTKASAVKIMVLPAPVSPVKTFRPLPSSSVDWSIIPRLRIEISSRYVRSLTAPAFNGKFKFSNKAISKQRWLQVGQLYHRFIFSDVNLVPRFQCELTKRIS
ncbi:unannotated protein [freshwater metagenome]|uniref:Unannotated protein n=1 Tax=freshwater metagenome TaxID=449393 RepID=A0A6J5ZIU5_9ZZZZ